MDCAVCNSNPAEALVHDYWNVEEKRTTALCRNCYKTRYNNGYEHFVSSNCKGEVCRICKTPATHKVKEDISWDEPFPHRHELVAYICCKHFKQLFGPAVHCEI
jgi:hypothetical protein